MLSIGKMGSGQEGYYLELASEDYYLEGGEPPGLWWGGGASHLGLEGEVARDALRALMDGVRPGPGDPLIQRQAYRDGRARTPGWDLTFSAPKSVSVLWSQAPQEIRERIQAAHLAAVKEALTYLEQEASFTRRGHGGKDLTPVRLIAALFEHGTSRASDPQLHTHALIVNVGIADDGRGGALRSRDLYRHKMVAGVLYRAALAQGLRQSLSVALERRESAFEIRGVPSPLIELFSSRRAAIEAAMKEAGAAGAKAAAKFTISTRQRKEHIAREVLFDAWRKLGTEFGFDISRIVNREKAPEMEVSRLIEGLRSIACHVMQKITVNESFFPERDVFRGVLERVQHLGLEPALIRASVGSMLHEPARTLSLAPDGPYARFTTVEMFRAEESLLEKARAIAGERFAPPTEIDYERAFGKKPVFQMLSDEQREAVRFLTAGHRFRALVGIAGSGKTITLDATREVFEQLGYRVIGLAPTGKARLELEKGAGIRRTFTVAKFLLLQETSNSYIAKHVGRQLIRAARGWQTYTREQAPLNAKTVVFLDEAGMLGTRQLEAVLTHIEKAGATLITSGDFRQLQAIEAGSPFRALTQIFGTTKLTEIRRQKHAWMRAAVVDFVEGRADAALERYLLEGKLEVSHDKGKAMSSLMRKWESHHSLKLKESLILAGTREDVHELNERAQKVRIQRGTVNPDRSCSFQGKRVCEGDRVVFGRNDRKLGVANGDFGEVVKIESETIAKALMGQRRITVRLDRTGKKGEPQLVTVDSREYRNLSLGYAATTHKAQGATIDRTFVLAGGWMQDRELSYVQFSRAREETHVFATVDEVGEKLADLAYRMSISRQKSLAHDLRPNLGQTLSPSLEL
jgi:conjugative relaxase-like TrwC/TraI family protein